MMKLQLRHLMDGLVGLMPAAFWTYIFKTFWRRPEFAQRAGYTVYPRTYYNPFPLDEEIDLAKLRGRRELPGIDLRVPQAMELLKELGHYRDELEQFPKDKEGRIEWWMTYPTLDSYILYTLLRHLKPRRYIEVGCGFSTRVSTAALRKNKEEGIDCEAVFIEPYPGDRLKGLVLKGQFFEQKIQDVSLEIFEKLEAGDVLFIDTSHVLKAQSDTEHEFLRILPRLKPGVLVHVHDIFTPYDYPEEWIVGRGPNLGANNEQYALECLISGGSWEILLPLHFLLRDHRENIENHFGLFTDRSQAFWIQKR